MNLTGRCLGCFDVLSEVFLRRALTHTSDHIPFPLPQSTPLQKIGKNEVRSFFCCWIRGIVLELCCIGVVVAVVYVVFSIPVAGRTGQRNASAKLWEQTGGDDNYPGGVSLVCGFAPNVKQGCDTGHCTRYAGRKCERGDGRRRRCSPKRVGALQYFGDRNRKGIWCARGRCGASLPSRSLSLQLLLRFCRRILPSDQRVSGM